MLLALALAAATVAPETPPPPLPLPRASAPITMDGALTDPAWEGAAVIDTFYETAFGDNRAPLVKTVARLMYDDRYFYVGLRCYDPHPDEIRAPYVDRDQVIGTDDNVAIFVDARNDRRTAQEFRVSPRGIQADGVFNDASGNEDFSPDFFYDTAARIDEEGWTAEVRIPLSSLRYDAGAGPRTWRILLWRNYPRQFRYAIYSSPLPRGSNCYICHASELTGIMGLPSSSHLVVAPYVSGQSVAQAATPGDPLVSRPTEANVGVDLKWNPGADTAVDATVNPDFSQVEADVAQIAVNNRFALFYPEKRPFFLEGADLFDTPIQAVYTRTVTDPRWGGRTTGKLGASTYTVLLAQDKGGGSVILPGPTSSDFAPQDFRSVVGIGRVRRDFGASFVGALYSGREIEGGGHNRVLGPDFQWRPNQTDTVTGQALLSDTETPRRPDLTPQWDGSSFTSHALHVAWNHDTRSIDWRARYRDLGDGFRADNGFVAQVGDRESLASVGYKVFPSGILSFVRTFVQGEYDTDRSGALTNRHVFPGVFVQGRKNLTAELDLNLDRVRTGNKVLGRTQLAYFVQVDPSRRFSRIGVQGFIGEDIDVVNVRTGHGAQIVGFATLKPTDHLSLDLNSALSWLDVPTGGAGGDARLFTAQVQRLKATYTASSRMFVRLIGQYVATDRDPALYRDAVRRRDATFSGSALFSYRLNWQTAFFLGYGDGRALDGYNSLVRTERQFFVKISYAFRH
jgi:hypothetical protein